MTTAMLTLDYEKKSKSEMGKLIAEVSVESVFQLIGIIATFFMASRREYQKKEKKKEAAEKVAVAVADEDEVIEMDEVAEKQRGSRAQGSVSLEAIRYG